MKERLQSLPMRITRVVQDQNRVPILLKAASTLLFNGAVQHKYSTLIFRIISSHKVACPYVLRSARPRILKLRCLPLAHSHTWFEGSNEISGAACESALVNGC